MKLSRAEFASLVDEALRDIPEALAAHLRNVAIDIETMPDRKTCEECGIDDPTELLGLYHGTPLTQRGGDDMICLPDRISIYQRNIEDMCETREEVIEQIRTTVFHEVGHFFGMEEDDLDELGFG